MERCGLRIVHTPVLLDECLSFLSPERIPAKETIWMVDATLGEGGHTEAFLQRYPQLHIIGVDADTEIQAKAKKRLAPFGERVCFYSGWFTDFYHSYPENMARPDIELFDLGISVFHYEESRRGFSFRRDEPLDMRLCSTEGRSAEDMVNSLPEQALADILYRYGEERCSRRVAHAIVQARAKSRIVLASELAEIIYESVPAAYRHGSIHPATKTFQALRIAVNRELERLPQVLPDAFSALETGGLLGVITFHSLEDRLVKNFFRVLGKSCVCPPEQPVCVCGGKPCAEILTRKPVVPGAAEIQRNSPSRSAKLRVIKKICDASPYRLNVKRWVGESAVFGVGEREVL